MKKFILLFTFLFISSCSTAVTVVDTAATGVINVGKGVVHITTCPFTKKDCF